MTNIFECSRCGAWYAADAPRICGVLVRGSIRCGGEVRAMRPVVSEPVETTTERSTPSFKIVDDLPLAAGHAYLPAVRWLLALLAAFFFVVWFLLGRDEAAAVERCLGAVSHETCFAALNP